MAKPGRTRINGERFPSGKVKPVERPRGYHPTAQKRLADAAIAGMADPEWGTVLGRLYLAGKLTSAEYAAGKRWAETWAEYCHHFGLPAPYPKTPVMGESAKGEPPDPESFAGKLSARAAARARKRFEEAHRELLKCGMQAESAVRRLCEGLGESPTGHAQFLHAQRGLQSLAKLWA